MILDDVPTTIAVASGKGGVGKTFMAVELAKVLADAGAEVGVLDVDLTTPDADRAAGVESSTEPSGGGRANPSPGSAATGGTVRSTAPIEVDGIQVVTKGTELPAYAVNTNDERMQRESAMAFARETDWNEGTTHVVVDTPPGTGWEIQTVLRDLRPDVGFVVTTGTVNAVRNACRTHELFRRVGLEHAVVANMRRYEPAIDRGGLRERLETLDGVAPERVEAVVDAIEDEVGGVAVPLHDDGVDLEDRFSVPVVADVPFTDDDGRIHAELRSAVDQVGLASTLPE